MIPYEPLHAVGADSMQVAYDNGRETALQRVVRDDSGLHKTGSP